jgi:GAF domain-containing protein
MLDWIRRLTATPTFEDENKARAARVLNDFLWALMLASVFLLPILHLFSPRSRLVLDLIFVTVASVSALMLFMLRRGRVRLLGSVISSVLWIAFTIPVYSYDGINDSAVVGYFVVIIMSSLILGAGAVFIFGPLTIAALTGAYILQRNGYIVPVLEMPPSLIDYLVILIAFSMTALLLRTAVRRIAWWFRQSQRNEAALLETNQELRESRDRLESQTRELAQRTQYLEAVARVARETTAVLEVNRLLRRVVEIMNEQFDLNRLRIFIVDDAQTWASAAIQAEVLPDQTLKTIEETSLQFRVGEESPIGYATKTGESYVTGDVQNDPLFARMRDSEGTRSELVLPLVARGQILGALDVHSAAVDAFEDEDVRMMMALTDQIAVALDNARLFQEAQEALVAERQARGEMAQEAWGRLLETRPDLGVVVDAGGATETIPAMRPGMEEALRVGGVVQKAAPDAMRLSLPIRVGGEIIGVIEGRRSGRPGDWSQDEIALIETLTDELSGALERARLYHDSQRLVARERAIGQVMQEVRRSLELEAVLQAAADEIRSAMQLERVSVRLTPPDGQK